MKFEWKEEFSVGVQEIDSQHKEIIESINKVYNFIYASEKENQFNSLLDYIEKISRAHFLTEEKYFDKFNYELTDQHKALHDKFFDKVMEVREQLRGNELEAAFKMGSFLEDWWVYHMSKEDQKYVQCFKEYGLK